MSFQINILVYIFPTSDQLSGNPMVNKMWIYEFILPTREI